MKQFDFSKKYRVRSRGDFLIPSSIITRLLNWKPGFKPVVKIDPFDESITISAPKVTSKKNG